MYDSNDYIDDESNIDDVEEGSDVPSVKNIMLTREAKNDNTRFSNAYNPNRRKMVTENDRPYENNSQITFDPRYHRSNNEIDDRAFNEVNSYKLNDFNQLSHKNSERQSIQHSKVEVNEEVYGHFSNYSGSNQNEEEYDGEGTASFRPSTNRNISGKLRYVYDDDKDVPVLSSKGNSLSPARQQSKSPQKYNKEDKQDINRFNQQAEVVISNALTKGKNITEALNKIDSMYINESLKQKKWINRSVMERRDQLRYEEYKNKQASHSLIRELKARNEIKGMNVVYTNKRSEKLAEKALRSKIKSVVISMSHNGYLAFEHF